MKLFITLSLTLLCLQAFSQDPITILRDTSDKKRDGIILSNGKVIWEGEQIKCGRGTMPNGNFKYITVSNMAFAAAGDPISRQYSGYF